MKKKLAIISIVASLMLVSMGIGAFAATKMTIMVNGQKVNAEERLINGVTYLPLRAIGEALGAQIFYDGNTKTISVVSTPSTPNTPFIPSTPSTSQSGSQGNSQGSSTSVQPTSNSVTIKDVTITLDRVEQDDDSLRLYVTYINNSNKAVSTGDSLSKIVSNGTQYGYQSSFNFERYYNNAAVVKAPGRIEPGVTAQSTIFFSPIPNVSTINVVLDAGWEDYRYNNVKVNVLK